MLWKSKEKIRLRSIYLTLTHFLQHVENCWNFPHFITPRTPHLYFHGCIGCRKDHSLIMYVFYSPALKVDLSNEILFFMNKGTVLRAI